MGKPVLPCSSQKQISLLSWKNMALVSTGSVASHSWQREFSPGNSPNVAADKKSLKCAE